MRVGKESEISDRELVLGLKASDIKAFDELYQRYKIKLYHFAFRIIKSRIETEGIIQEVFMKLWDGRRDLNEEEMFSSWIYRVTYNLTIDKFRKKCNEEDYIEYLKYISTSSSLDTEKVVNHSSLKESIEKAINLLPEQRAKIYRMSRIQGLSNPEIADQLKLSMSTVKNQLVSASKFIKKELSHLRSVLISIL